MSEYIGREALESAAKEYPWYSGLKTVLKRIPAADVAPVKRGKWGKGTGENGVTTSLFCSVCHYENTHWHEWNYCPNCGARMAEEGENTDFWGEEYAEAKGLTEEGET